MPERNKPHRATKASARPWPSGRFFHDTPVTTYVRTKMGEMHFQEYWVKHRGDVAIDGVVRRFSEPPVATEEVIEAIERSDAVVVGPSNPVTSISPILECAGVREALRRQRVIAAHDSRSAPGGSDACVWKGGLLRRDLQSL